MAPQIRETTNSRPVWGSPYPLTLYIVDEFHWFRQYGFRRLPSQFYRELAIAKFPVTVGIVGLFLTSGDLTLYCYTKSLEPNLKRHNFKLLEGLWENGTWSFPDLASPDIINSWEAFCVCASLLQGGIECTITFVFRQWPTGKTNCGLNTAVLSRC